MAQKKKKIDRIISKSRVYKLYPNELMETVLFKNCDYRRFCWNKGLEIWNREYQEYVMNAPEGLIKEMQKSDGRKLTPECKEILKAFPNPSEYQVRDLMVAQKQSWQKRYSSRILQLAVKDLAEAWSAFIKHTQARQGKPKFRSKRSSTQSFKSDQVKFKAVNGQAFLHLDKPREYTGEWSDIRMSERPLEGKYGVATIKKQADGWYLSLAFDVSEPEPRKKTGKATGVDVNISHFDYIDGTKRFLYKSSRLAKEYRRIIHYQRQLARKRVENGTPNAYRSKRYQKTRIKLQRAYQRVKRLQEDEIQKFTTELVKEYDAICIETLSVKGMLMSHRVSKGVHSAMFGRFKSILEYKCKWHGCELVMADRLYPSTQRCAACGNVKKGDDKITLYGNKKHGTKHDEYVCYNEKCPNYNKVVDRDRNAMMNLTLLIDHPELNRAL